MATPKKKSANRSKQSVKVSDLQPNQNPRGGRQTPKTDFGSVLGQGISGPAADLPITTDPKKT